MSEELKAAQARIAELEAWKAEEIQVMSPLMDYARGVCAGPIGCSLADWLIRDHKRLRAELAAIKASARDITAMVDAAMIEMANISPPMRRNECERLIRAAFYARPVDAQAIIGGRRGEVYDEEKERASFEAQRNPSHSVRFADGAYQYVDVDLKWQGWSACAKSRAMSAGKEGE